MADLPLQAKISRTTITTRGNNVTAITLGGASEQLDEVINPVAYGWSISYSPLSIVDKTTVEAFLLGVGYSGVFSIDIGCTSPVTYVVRMDKDTLSISRSRGKYVVSFNITEQVW